MSRIVNMHIGKVGMKPLIYKFNSGASGQVEIGTSGTGFDYDVFTQDGQGFFGNTGNLIITFPATNTDYLVEIRGDFPYPDFYSLSTTNRNKLIQIIQKGDIVLGSDQANSYRDCVNLTGSLPLDYIMEGVTNPSGALRNTALIGIKPPLMTLESATTTNGTFFGVQMTGIANFDLQNCTDVANMFFTSLFSEVHIINMDNVVSSNAIAFGMGNLTKLTLQGMRVSFAIRYSPLLVGTEIDATSTSLADLTGVTSQSVTMTTAQRGSGIDETILTLKNWTIVEV